MVTSRHYSGKELRYKTEAAPYSNDDDNKFQKTFYGGRIGRIFRVQKDHIEGFAGSGRGGKLHYIQKWAPQADTMFLRNAYCRRLPFQKMRQWPSFLPINPFSIIRTFLLSRRVFRC